MKAIAFVGPQGSGKSSVREGIQERLSEANKTYSSLISTGYYYSPFPINKIGKLTGLSIRSMDTTQIVLPFITLAGINTTILYPMAAYLEKRRNPDYLLVQRNPFYDTWAMGEVVLSGHKTLKKMSRLFAKGLASGHYDLLVHLDADPEILLDRIRERKGQLSSETGRKYHIHPYENHELLAQIREGYFQSIDEKVENNSLLRLNTDNLTLKETVEAVYQGIKSLG